MLMNARNLMFCRASISSLILVYYRCNKKSFAFQDLLKKCHQCVETIVKAKDQQAAEANKNATILLKELDLEKVSGELWSSSLMSKAVI